MIDRTSTHHFGFASVNIENDLAFIRISKCGSTTFVRRHKLTKLVPFSELDNFTHVMAAVRNPLDRFLSSIPETLKRIRPKSLQTTNSIINDNDVFVNDNIYEEVCRIFLSSSDSFIERYCMLIDSFSFFDAHHEPQIYFFYDDFNNIYDNVRIFPLDKMNCVSDIIRFESNTKTNIRLTQSENSRCSSLPSKMRRIKQSLLYSRTNPLKKIGIKIQQLEYESRWIKSLAAHKLRNHPIHHLLSINGKSLSAKNINLSLVQFYNELKVSALRNNELLKFVECTYKTDILLFKAAEKYWSENKIHKISSLPLLINFVDK